MLNYIRADLYRNFNRKYFWIYTGIMSLLAFLFVIVCRTNTLIPNISLNTALEAATINLALAIYLIPAFIEMTISDEQKNQTFKNVIAFGVKRNTVVISKLISTILLAAASALIILSVFLISGLTILGGPSDLLLEFMLKFLYSSVLWIGALSLGNFMALFFNSSNIFALAYAGVFLITTNLIKLLSIFVSDKFSYISEILITSKLTNIIKQPLSTSNVSDAILLGAAYTIVFTVLSMILLRNKEIK
ncbi:ABC transporter permease [Clostridium sp.]|uniref:ABC transporter permease n=1 Tax=Clostridium sp. TaxID=1506 RepID=UPI0034649343